MEPPPGLAPALGPAKAICRWVPLGAKRLATLLAFASLATPSTVGNHLSPVPIPEQQWLHHNVQNNSTESISSLSLFHNASVHQSNSGIFSAQVALASWTVEHAGTTSGRHRHNPGKDYSLLPSPLTSGPTSGLGAAPSQHSTLQTTRHLALQYGCCCRQKQFPASDWEGVEGCSRGKVERSSSAKHQ